MKATEFCYWLQGLFELVQPKVLTTPQIECIKRHLALSEAIKDDDSPKLVKEFTAWLRTSLEWMDPSVPDHVHKVQFKLDQCFAHVIDKNYGPDGKLNEIHNPPHLRPPDGSGIRPRC